MTCHCELLARSIGTCGFNGCLRSAGSRASFSAQAKARRNPVLENLEHNYAAAGEDVRRVIVIMVFIVTVRMTVAVAVMTAIAATYTSRPVR